MKIEENDELSSPPDEDLAAEEIKWPAAEFELKLRRPIKIVDEEVDTILLREPTGEEWEKMIAHPAPTRRRYGVSLIGGIPMKSAAQILIGDLVRGEEYLNSFFEVGLTIGAK